MQIIINDKQNILGEQAIEKAEAKIRAAFSKFGYKVRSVELTTDRGGIDKECRLVVKLKKMDQVITSTKDESLSKAIASSISRAERVVARRLFRRAYRDAYRRSKIGLAIFN